MSGSKLSDVAEEAKVSITTASQVLNGKGNISKDVRCEVLRAASALNYKPLRVRKVSHAVEPYVLIMDFSSLEDYTMPFYLSIIEGIADGFSGTPCFSSLVQLNDSITPQLMLKRLKGMGAKMAFFVECVNVEMIDYLEKHGITTVVVSNNKHNDRCMPVSTDDFQGAYDATRHLIDNGHKDILFVDLKRKSSQKVSMDRYIGFKKAMDEAGLNFNERRHVYFDEGNLSKFRKQCKIFKNKKTRPTAIFLHHDLIHLKLIPFLLEQGLKVPDDVSVVAPGDVLNYRDGDPYAITTVRSDARAIGKLAAQVMLERKKDSKVSPQAYKLSPQLVDRGSCRKL